MPIIPLGDKRPKIGRDVFIASTAYVIGDVTICDRASVWPYAVLRGDLDSIYIGEETNVQDGVIIHTDSGYPVRIGARVTIGHRAIVHGAIIEDDVVIGMGAIIMNGAVIGRGSIIGAGAVVTQGMRIPPNSIAIGVPARVVREATDKDREYIRVEFESYKRLAELYKGLSVSL